MHIYTPVALVIVQLPIQEKQEMWFDPELGKISHSRKWQPISLFLPGEFHVQRSLEGYRTRGSKESDMTEPSTDKHRYIPVYNNK